MLKLGGHSGFSTVFGLLILIDETLKPTWEQLGKARRHFDKAAD
jgi:hypothetical protein